MRSLSFAVDATFGLRTGPAGSEEWAIATPTRWGALFLPSIAPDLIHRKWWASAMSNG